jgi:hypothetical protein
LGYDDKKYKNDDTEQLGDDEDGWLQLADHPNFGIGNFLTLAKARELLNFLGTPPWPPAA